ncbi:MAG TPA: radical SAM protein, partial [bacterium]|nr:radical SAM protein [bacterium]
WKQKTGVNFSVNYARNDSAFRVFAQETADSDVIAFSLMSVQRNIAVRLIEEIRRINPSARIIVGGYHPTLDPEDAISFSDIIVRGEGERVFVKLLDTIKEGLRTSDIPNTWSRENGTVRKNPAMPLMTPSEMEQMPFMEYSLENTFIFSYSRARMKKTDREALLQQVGTTYNTIWSVGCPYRCTFCSHAKLADFERGYAQYRGPSPSYIIEEIKRVKKMFPVEYVIFYDSNFLGRPLPDIIDFSERFKREIGVKIVLSGVNPVSVTEEKMDPLIEGGLVRMKVGIEAGNEAALRLYGRAADKRQISRAAEIFSRYRKRMAAPAFEMILDNPYETVGNLMDTVDFLDSLPGPFTLNLFSLQFMPYTSLSENSVNAKRVAEHKEKEYMFSYSPTAINNLISLFAIFNPPRFIVSILKRFIKGREVKVHPAVKTLLFKLMLFRRAIDQARVGDYSTFPSSIMLMHHWVKGKTPLFANRHRTG